MSLSHAFLQPPERSSVFRLVVEIIEILINIILISLAPISLIFTQSRGSSTFREIDSLTRLPVIDEVAKSEYGNW